MTRNKVDTIMGVWAMTVLGTLVAAGYNGPIKAALLSVVIYFFGLKLLPTRVSAERLRK
jgi:hypothetical protein